MSLFRTAAHMAVASSVHGRIQRRQAQRWAAPSQTTPAAPAPTPAPAPAPAPTLSPDQPEGQDDLSRRLAQLAQLGELRAAGILTEAEFEAKKALILAG